MIWLFCPTVGFACFRPLVQVKIAIDHGPNAKSPREAGFFCWLRGQDLNKSIVKWAGLLRTPE
ncbi:hypothetical protein, partial [Mesorhizobium sp. LNJC380A00]|uniref:hypothetical protein n=1 Tax=Mesorhizobium sp. LNJC380A00 TaxID=1287264 RepID=UPI001AEC1910